MGGMNSAYASRGPEGRRPAAHESGGAESLDLFDVIALAWSQRGFIFIIFAIIFAIGATASIMLLQPSYEAQSRLLVVLDANDPTPGAAGSGGAFELDQVMQSESEILNSDPVRRRAIAELGAETLIDGELPPDADATSIALRAMRGGFSVGRAPNASVLVARYEHDDPQIAALALNAIVRAYLDYRRDVLIGEGAGGVLERRGMADEAYALAQSDLDAFLNEHQIADFPAALSASVQRVSSLQERLLTANAERDAAQAGAQALAQRLANLPETVELSVENGASNRLLELRVERQSLIARYQEDAPAVVAIDREIEEINNFLAAGQAAGMGNITTGPNPVWQGLESDRLAREATARQEAQRAATIERQLSAARAETSRLRALAPEYERLAREATARQEAATRLAGQAAEASTRRAAPGAADAIRIVEAATPPMEGSSMKKLGVIGSFIAAAGIAGFLGLIRGYWLTYLRPQRMHWRQPAPAPVMAHPEPVAPSVAAAPHPVSAAEASLADIPVLARIADRGF